MGCRLCSPTAPGRCLHFECRGAPARVRAWRCEGRPPLPHHFVCVEKSTLPYLTLITKWIALSQRTDAFIVPSHSYNTSKLKNSKIGRQDSVRTPSGLCQDSVRTPPGLRQDNHCPPAVNRALS